MTVEALNFSYEPVSSIFRHFPAFLESHLDTPTLIEDSLPCKDMYGKPFNYAQSTRGIVPAYIPETAIPVKSVYLLLLCLLNCSEVHIAQLINSESRLFWSFLISKGFDSPHSVQSLTGIFRVIGGNCGGQSSQIKTISRSRVLHMYVLVHNPRCETVVPFFRVQGSTSNGVDQQSS